MKHWLINPTWRCHSRCRYCWLNDTIRARPELLNAPERPYEDWLAAIRRDKPDVVDIAGGEPYLLPWINKLIAACPEIMFGISSNGLEYERIVELAEMRPQNIVGLNLSYHPDAAERWADYDTRWRNAVWAVRKTGGMPGPNIVDYEDNVAKSQGALQWLKTQRIVYAISPYEDMGILAEKQAQGLCCRGGVDHLVVAPDGSAWPCLSTLRSPYWRETCLGNWLDGTVDVSRKEQPCLIYCIDHYILESNHSCGDMWGVAARPCEEAEE